MDNSIIKRFYVHIVKGKKRVFVCIISIIILLLLKAPSQLSDNKT